MAALLAQREVENRHLLFKTAIVQSMPMGIQFRTKQQAKDLAKEFLGKINCTDSILPVYNWDCARRKSTEEVAAVVGRMNEPIDFNHLSSLFETWAPILDEDILDMHPYDAFLAGRSQERNIIAGHTSGEGATFVYGILREPVGKQLYQILVQGYFRNDTVSEKILEYYPSDCRVTDRDCDMRPSISQIINSYLFACPLRRSLKNRAQVTLERETPALGRINSFLPGRTFRYIFDHPTEVPGVAVCGNVSCHTAELPYIFQTFEEMGLSPSEEELTLSDRMINFWTNFAWSGDPNQGSDQFWDQLRDPVGYNLTDCWHQYMDKEDYLDNCGSRGQFFLASEYLTTGEQNHFMVEPVEIDRNCNFWDDLDIYLDY